jgi:hypothetical protein
MINWNKMIEGNEIFLDSDKRIALWCETVEDTNDLAIISENIIDSGIDLISVPPEIVSGIWVYLEKTPVKILSRYDFFPKSKNIDDDISELSKNIKQSFNSGSDGAQIFLNMSVFEDFVEKIALVRDDLFFNKDFCVVFDIEDVDVNDWNNIFQKLHMLKTDSLMFTFKEDALVRSDFVGRIYGMLKNWDFDGELHFALNNNYDRIDQVIRLIESEKPELQDKIKFFLEY